MTSDKVDGQHRYKSQQQAVDNDGGRAGVYADNQRQAGNQFQKRECDRNQVDENLGKKAVAVHYFGKIRG